MDFASKVIVVTGGASGIGHATAREFAVRNGAVAIFDRNDEAGRETAEALRGAGHTVEYFHVDVYKRQAAVSLGSQNRLRMKLHGFDRQLAVTQAHDDAVIRLGGHFQARGESFAHGEQRMIAAHLKTFRQPLEHARAGVPHPCLLYTSRCV